MNSIKVKRQSLEKEERKILYYQKDPSVTTLYIGNLRYTKTEKDLKVLLEKFGKVKYVKLVVDPKTNKSKGIAFAQMPNKKHALLAIESLNDSQLDGRSLKVSIAKDRVEGRHTKTKYIEKFVAEEKTIESVPAIKVGKKRRPQGLKVLFNYLNG